MNQQIPLDTSTIGGRIRFLRKRKKLTMDQLALEVGSTQGNISDWENHKKAPSAKYLIEIAEFFNVSIDWLLKGNESIDSPDTSTRSHDSRRTIMLAAYQQIAATHVEMRLMQNFPKTYLLIIETKDFEGYLKFLAWIEQNPPENMVLRIIRTLPEAEE